MPKAGTAAVIPNEGPLPDLRTGVDSPKINDEIELKFVASRFSSATYLEFSTADISDSRFERVHVDLPGAVAVATLGHVIIRIPAGGPRVPRQFNGALVGKGSGGRAVTPFVASFTPTDDDPELPKRWTAGMAGALRRRGRQHPWRQFASGRIQALAELSTQPNALATRPGRQRPSSELSQLMYTTTGATSMQEALQVDRGLGIRMDSGERTISLAELNGPPLEDHPFKAMQRALPDPDAGVPEPLAAATPADFWYVRFDDLRVMLRMLDEADTWITPVAHIIEARSDVHDLSKRYQQQLGLHRWGLAKALGHTVVDRVAVVGSDAYLRDGSDVTFIFEVSSQGVFDNELSGHMRGYKAEVPEVSKSTLAHGKHTITIFRDPTRAVNQHRARVGNLSIVSNSAQACKAVLDAIDGKGDRLSEQPDLDYMLARDPGVHDGFAFMSDRFIAKMVSPTQKILAARRQLALAELLTPGYSALLHGWVEGRAPESTQSLIASGLLQTDELTHTDGEPIRFSPGTPAVSAWGRVNALTPLIDLPTPTLVSEQERDAYATFSRGYQNYWRQFVDPISIRFDVEDHAQGSTVTLDVRVLPLISGTEYSELAEIVGEQRIEVPSLADGAQLVWAIGAESEVRGQLDHLAGRLTGSSAIGIGWLGDWVMLGTLDRRGLVDVMALFEDDVQRPAGDGEQIGDKEALKAIGTLPIYVAAQVNNRMTLVATLAALRTTVNSVAAGMVQWQEYSRYKDHPIVRIGASASSEFAEYSDVALYYAQPGDALIVALSDTVLKELIDREALPKRAVQGGAQFVAQARIAKGRSAWTALLWALQGQATQSQSFARATAEILLRGDPSLKDEAALQQLGLAYFGAYPVSASGRSDFTLTRFGASDPVHGSDHAPRYPALPVEGSPVAGVMERLKGLNATVAFDREPADMDPPARSLHTHLELELEGG